MQVLAQVDTTERVDASSHYPDLDRIRRTWIAYDAPLVPGLGVDRLTLVEAAPRVLGPFHPKSSAHAQRTLEQRGVDVITGTGVDHVEADGVVLADGRCLPATVIVWAAGVTGNPVAELLGVPLARGGRIPVAPDLSLAGHPEVFAIGDIAASPTEDTVAQRPMSGVTVRPSQCCASASGCEAPKYAPVSSTMMTSHCSNV